MSGGGNSAGIGRRGAERCSTTGGGGGDDTSAASAASAASTTGGTVRTPQRERGHHGYGSNARAAAITSDAAEEDDDDAAGDERRRCHEEEEEGDDGGITNTNYTSDEDDDDDEEEEEEEEDDCALMERITSALLASNHPIHGSDSRGLRTYSSIANLWNDQPDDRDNIDDHFDGNDGPLWSGEWYDRALRVYDDPDVVPATVDGMLGGQSHVSRADVSASRAFLIQVLGEMTRSEPSGQPGTGGSRAAEMGAGIGRVTKHLLLPIGYDNCDLIESSSRLLEAAPGYLGDEVASKCRFFCTGLQDWTPPSSNPQIYDLIWVQWVMCYLTDVDFVRFLRRCRLALRTGGLVVLKENVLSRDVDGLEEAFVVDEDDASLTRSLPYLETLCDLAGFDVVHSTWQEDFPPELFPVRMIALVPRKRKGRR